MIVRSRTSARKVVSGVLRTRHRTTDPNPPSELDEIVTTGQRRWPGGQFPPASGSAGYGEPPEGPVPIQVEEGEPEQPRPPDPCSNPETALDWNADAAAAEAAKEFARRAAARTPPETLNDREWGAYLYRAADGSIQIGPIAFGPPFSSGGVGTVNPSTSGLDPSTIVGSIHSHGSGNHLRSDGNEQFPGDIDHLNGLVVFSGNTSARLYIVAQNQGPAGFVPYNQINVYNQAKAQDARSNFAPGPEVNPEAEPCPGS